MLTEKDKFCTALATMHEMREQLVTNFVNKDADLFEGLHSTESQVVMDLYMEKYRLMWLDKHWNTLSERLSEQRKSGKLYEKEMDDSMSFFARYFLDFLNRMNCETKFASELYMNFIDIKIKTLDDLIGINDRTEKNKAVLRTEMKKHKEKFDELIRQYKKN